MSSIRGILFKESNIGVIHIKVISQHCGIQVPSQGNPLEPNNQGHTFQDSLIEEVHIKVILQHDGIQVPFQEIPSKALSIWDRLLQGLIKRDCLNRTVYQAQIIPRVD